MTFYVIACPDGHSEPTIMCVFFTEEKAIKYAKEFGSDVEESIPRVRMTHQFDLNVFDPRPYIYDGQLWLGKMEEGEHAEYYRCFFNEQYLETMEWYSGEQKTLRTI